MNNVRNQVFELLVASLKTIKKSAGYNFDIKTVERIHQTLESIDSTKFPAIFVLDAGIETPETFDAHSPRPGHNLEIPCVLYFKGSQNNLVESEFSNFISDLSKWAYSNPSFSPHADNFALLSFETILSDPPDKVGIMTVKLTYWFDRSNP